MWSLLASLDAYKFEASFPFFLPLWCLVLSLHPTKICIEPKKSMLSGSMLVTTHKRKTRQTCPLHKIPGSTFRVGTSGATPSGLTRRAGAWSCRSPAQGRRPAAFSASSASFLSPNPSTASERHHNADRLSRLWRWRPPFLASDAHSRLCRGTLRLLEGR